MIPLRIIEGGLLMKRNVADLLKIGVVIPALVLSLAACGNSGSGTQDSKPETEAAEAEGTGEAAAADEGAQDQTQAPAEAVTYENAGKKITVPAELADKISVSTPEKSEDSVLFEAYEIASVEADKALGNDGMGGGWLFSICTRTEEEFRRIICSDASGEEVIGSDADGVYYVFYHPTDVRYVRESAEQMEKDQEDWTKACEWADSVRTSFAADNGITAFSWSNTVVESYLARTCYDENAKYTISTLEFGPLEPSGVDAEKYFKLLTTDAVYELVEEEAPDGEYAVLTFPDDDIRFDFFFAEGGENYIRQVWNNEENEELYKVTFADSEKKASAIMQEWYDEIAAAAGKK